MPRFVALGDLTQFTAVQLLSDPGAIAGPVQVPQCAQIVLRWTLEDGKTAHNVLYGRYAGGFAGTVAQANSIMTALTSGAAWTQLASGLATTTFFAGVDIRDVNTPNQPIISSSNAAVPGTGTGASLPNEVAIGLTLRTARTGRQFRGRIYLPGQVVAAVAAGNVIAATYVTQVSNWGATIITAFSAQGYTLSLGLKARAAYTSPITGRQFPARAATSEPVTTVLCRDNHFDSQRRRGLR